MLIYFCRHGQTDWNKAGRWQSRSEVPLNATGLAQSQAVAATLAQGLSKQEKPSVMASPMGRAQQTAAVIAEALGLVPQTEPLFIELDLGDFEGRLHSDLLAEEASFAEWFTSYHLLAAPNGESLADGVARVRPALQQLLAAQPEGGLVIVAHQAINMAMKVLLTGESLATVSDKTLAGYKQSNAQIDIWRVAHGDKTDDDLRGEFIERIEVEV